jgi:MOSC domain-containing protein YiiM
MISKILSLNCGHPAPMEWEGKSIISSMLRHPVPGPLIVHKTHIEGNSFNAPQLHGLEHAVLYAFGMKSAMSFMKLLERETYSPGSVGENLTLDDLDEEKISVGDIFEIGEVLAQAVYPRIPCGKVNFRLQHPQGQKVFQACGRSGIYFRILRPGKIFLTDEVKLVERAIHRISIFELYDKMINQIQFNNSEMQLALANGAFPKKAIEKWKALLA